MSGSFKYVMCNNAGDSSCQGKCCHAIEHDHDDFLCNECL